MEKAKQKSIRDNTVQDSVRKTEPQDGYKYWPTHVLNQAILYHIVLGLIITLSVLAPFNISQPADPLNAPVLIKPHWYFLPWYQLSLYIPPVVVSLFTFVMAIVLLFWPFFDRVLDNRSMQNVYRKIGTLIIAFLIFLGALGWISGRSINLAGFQIRIDKWGIPHSTASNKVDSSDSAQNQVDQTSSKEPDGK